MVLDLKRMKQDQIYCVSQDIDGEGGTETRTLQYRGVEYDSFGLATLVFWEDYFEVIGSPVYIYSGDIIELEEDNSNYFKEESKWS